MQRSAPLIVILTLAVLAAACGDDASPPIGPGTTADPTATTAAPTTTTEPPAPSTTEVVETTSVPTTTTSTSTTTTTTLPPLQRLALETVGEGYANPIFVSPAPGDDRLYVVEKPGRIRIVGEDAVFLDITGLTDEDGLEQGLLGLAFHPDYAANGRFFVHYTDRNGTSTLAEYAADPVARTADPGSASILLTVPQPRGNHNGGMIDFGPDGYLWVALGDGGGANDRYGNGQRTDTLLGTLLRLDVDSATPYAIPPDNPFVDGGGAMEVWAYGLRNPWRFSFDRDLIYIGDVGQRLWEEIDAAPVSAAGLNYGWPITEGESCFETSSCDTEGLTPPILDYGHNEGCSVTGGYVYRGSSIPELDGHYFFSDWCGGWIRSLKYLPGEGIVEEADWSGDLAGLSEVVSFGRDLAGEVYVVTQGGTVYKIVAER